MNRTSLVISAFLVLNPSSGLMALDGALEVRVVNESGSITAARAWVDSGQTRLFQPSQPDTVVPYPKDESFSSNGVFTVSVPAGKATLHVEKGKEYVPIDLPVRVVAGETIKRTVHLQRWVNMPKRGWYSADLHVHLGHDDVAVLTQLALADDVHLIPSFTYWLRGAGETWNATWPSDDFTAPIKIDPHHIITRNNIEIERINIESVPGGSIGATFLFNLNQPVIAPSYGEHFPTDTDLCRIARADSPASVFDCDKPSWAETVVGVALGQVDTVQVCHNHYHRSKTIPGRYGMIGPLSPGESNVDEGDGLFHRTNNLYYRFLNCGFQLGASGGSAVGVMALPTGHNRTYAQIDGEFTAEKMWASIKAGRSFATTGPMMTLSANDRGIGSNLDAVSHAGEPIKIRTSVEAVEELESLQIIHNGMIVSSKKLIGQTGDLVVKAELEWEVQPQRSGWVAARALYRAPDGLLRQAHTSPIYLTVGEQSAAFAPDARYMLRWIDRLVEIANSDPNRFPTSEARDAVLTTYAQARERYEAVVAKAQH